MREIPISAHHDRQVLNMAGGCTAPHDGRVDGGARFGLRIDIAFRRTGDYFVRSRIAIQISRFAIAFRENGK